ncbi:MAG: hypothetical protein ABSD31_01410 [Candidatus Binataceae bacterium]|jgi:Mrp family chromosome partitioning ATPase
MGRFYKALQREEFETQGFDESGQSGGARLLDLAPVKPPALSLASEVAQEDSISHLTRQLSALSVAQGKFCIHVTGCRSGDGASTVSAAIAIELSQRLGLNTILVDGHLRRPSLHRLLLSADAAGTERPGRLNKRIVPTGWSRLDLVVGAGAGGIRDLRAEFDAARERYSAAVIDLGVAQLDPAVLGLVQNCDPVLLVVRAGHTARGDLRSTMRLLTTANLTAAGVILNATRDSSASGVVRRLFGKGA